MEASKAPKVSIGLAVFNGEEFIEEAIDSILSQTFTDFELIISDNASTDRTSEICQRYQAKDSRIRYHCNETNIGGANNENLTFRMSRGRYFRWAAHDDVCAPQLLEKCVDVLDNEPDIVLCNTLFTKIDEHGKTLCVTSHNNGGFCHPHERLRALASFDHDCEEIYGLIRSNTLAKTQVLLNYTDCDRTLLAELSLYGQFHQVPEHLFYKRIHSNMSVLAFPDWYGRMAWFNPKLDGRITFPNWQQFFHYIRAIAKAPIGATEKIRCYRYMLGWLFLEYHGRGMIRDFRMAVKKVLGSQRKVELARLKTHSQHNDK